MHRVFIDGQSGTTGLQIEERLAHRDDITLLSIDEDRRKDASAKLAVMSEADVVILCLPDDAAREAVALSNNARFIDASTAHRVNPDWVYGFAELASDQRDAIRNARLVSNPGCYPTGFLGLTRPLVDAGLLDKAAPITVNAVSGYSGGGKQMIANYEARSEAEPDNLWYARPYGLSLQHKHVPEMQQYAGLDTPPVFLPSVGHFHQGMLVNVPLHASFMTRETEPAEVAGILADHYEGEACIRVFPANDEGELDAGFLDPQACNGTNRMDLFVYGHGTQMVLTARLDNLGKGASGAAVQNLNLMLGQHELEGLKV